MPFSEYNEKTIRKSLKTRNYSTETISNSPLILPEESVAPSGESFRNTFFFLAHGSAVLPKVLTEHDE